MPADKAWEWESPQPQGQTLKTSWAFASDDVWAAGDYGALVHWDGKAWTAARLPTYESIRTLWGASPTDVWAAGNNGTLLHCDGDGWSQAAAASDFHPDR